MLEEQRYTSLTSHSTGFTNMDTSFQADDVNPPGPKHEAGMTYKVHGGRLYDKQFTLVKGRRRLFKRQYYFSNRRSLFGPDYL
jgi:hypothetical protein